MFIQYRKAYGPYAAILAAEFERVQVEVDSLPSWAIIRVCVEPDYTIKIGAVDRTNSVTRYFRVKGPKFEAGLTLGVPKVLYDTRAKDSIDYGHTSAMLRFYYIDVSSGHRFPVNLGVGTFGVNSPIDVSVGRGGFAASMFLLNRLVAETLALLQIPAGLRKHALDLGIRSRSLLLEIAKLGDPAKMKALLEKVGRQGLNRDDVRRAGVRGALRFGGNPRDPLALLCRV